MNLLKKMAAVSLVAALMLSFCGCHKKNEVAMKIDGKDYKTSMYIAAVYEVGYAAYGTAYSDAQSKKVDTENDEDFYLKQKIDKKNFVDYVKENALDQVKSIAACEALMKKYKLKLTDEELQQVDQFVNAYWSANCEFDGDKKYTVGKYYENNGVNKETYTNYYKGTILSSICFNKLYGDGGKKAISKDEIKKHFVDNFVVVNIASTAGDFSEKTDDEKAKIKSQYEGYVKDINSGKKDFKAVYSEIQAASGNASTSEGAAEPQNAYFSADDDDKTDYEKYNKMTVGKAELVELDDGAGYNIVYKKDIKADKDGATNYDSQIRQTLKGDEFQKEIDASKKALKITEYKSAINGVKIKKINFKDVYTVIGSFYAALQSSYMNQ